MKTIGILILAAATAPGFGKPHVANRLLHPHVVRNGPPPASGPIMPGAMGGGLHGGVVPAGFDGGAGGGIGFGAAPRQFANTQSQLFFADPVGMKVGWQTGAGSERVFLPGQLTVPARYNFRQGYVYRLKVSDVPGYPGLNLYPSIEVAPTTPATDAYLTHNPIPVVFTDEDIDQVRAGNFVTKVVYLPDPRFQELAVPGVETLVSTRLEPGIDPILEADRRGTILMILRVGAIDLEMPDQGSTTVIGGASTAPGPYYGPESMAPPTVPMDEDYDYGSEYPAPPSSTIPSVPLDAPVSPAAPQPQPGPVDTGEELIPGFPTP